LLRNSIVLIILFLSSSVLFISQVLSLLTQSLFKSQPFKFVNKHTDLSKFLSSLIIFL